MGSFGGFLHVSLYFGVSGGEEEEDEEDESFLRHNTPLHPLHAPFACLLYVNYRLSPGCEDAADPFPTRIQASNPIFC